MMILLVIWIIALIFLNKLNLKFFKFVLGSLGTFIFLIHYTNDILRENILKVLAFVLNLIGGFITNFEVFPEYGMLTVTRTTEVITFFLDYECTGILEIMVYISLVAFYPIRGPLSKIYYMITGIVYITAVNLLRVMIIVFIIQGMGMKYFFFAHTVIARLIFFIFVVTLYYRTFTLEHIVQQKVGVL
ncbi:MAG: exosortase family protein XrtG [Firmicutes bacterium HGW-Firmicutes-3]|jgi:exosortase family protein XrtG|nr:MAG: exosortase family protein XrtG [Firmicutes bacterium HGW-Firmicutes-3]